MATDTRFAIVRRQLEAHGWTLVRISDSHHIFKKPGAPLLSIPVHHNRVKTAYVRQVQKLIQEAEQQEQEGGAGD
jgi:predicted RNA binding protein YcfA (HicA-like mRNA interferase family)